MYTAPQKRFRPRDEEEVIESIRRCGDQFGDSVKRVFLADGDAMTLSTAVSRPCSRQSVANCLA